MTSFNFPTAIPRPTAMLAEVSTQQFPEDPLVTLPLEGLKLRIKQLFNSPDAQYVDLKLKARGTLFNFEGLNIDRANLRIETGCNTPAVRNLVRTGGSVAEKKISYAWGETRTFLTVKWKTTPNGDVLSIRGKLGIVRDPNSSDTIIPTQNTAVYLQIGDQVVCTSFAGDNKRNPKLFIDTKAPAPLDCNIQLMCIRE